MDADIGEPLWRHILSSFPESAHDGSEHEDSDVEVGQSREFCEFNSRIIGESFRTSDLIRKKSCIKIDYVYKFKTTVLSFDR